MTDPNKGFTVSDNGLFIDADTGVWIGGGAAVPTFNAPQGSRYFRTDPSELYIQEASGYTNDWQLFVGGSSVKSGVALVGAFTGSPKKATVTINTPFADTNYAVTLTVVSTVNSNSAWVPIVESKAAGSFVIHLNSSKTNDLVSVLWTAAVYSNP